MITAELIQPVVQAVTNNITAYGSSWLSILALSLGVSAVPENYQKILLIIFGKKGTCFSLYPFLFRRT